MPGGRATAGGRRRLRKDALLLSTQYQPQALARIFNGVSKWPEDKNCREAAVTLAEALWQRRDELDNPGISSPRSWP